MLPVSATCVTGPMRAIMPGAASGSSAVSPKSVWPLVTVSRLVPSRSISASSPACEEAERPSTATIAATPIAMPSAESPARSRRVRTPMLATRARSARRSLRGAGLPAVLTRCPGGRLTSANAAAPACLADGLDDVAAGLAVCREDRRDGNPGRVRPDPDDARCAAARASERPARTLAGAENVTSAPDTGLASASVTVTASRIGKRRPSRPTRLPPRPP